VEVVGFLPRDLACFKIDDFGLLGIIFEFEGGEVCSGGGYPVEGHPGIGANVLGGSEEVMGEIRSIGVVIDAEGERLRDGAEGASAEGDGVGRVAGKNVIDSCLILIAFLDEPFAIEELKRKTADNPSAGDRRRGGISGIGGEDGDFDRPKHWRGGSSVVGGLAVDGGFFKESFLDLSGSRDRTEEYQEGENRAGELLHEDYKVGEGAVRSKAIRIGDCNGGEC